MKTTIGIFFIWDSVLQIYSKEFFLSQERKGKLPMTNNFSPVKDS
jgi:hypothetical protein